MLDYCRLLTYRWNVSNKWDILFSCQGARPWSGYSWYISAPRVFHECSMTCCCLSIKMIMCTRWVCYWMSHQPEAWGPGIWEGIAVNTHRPFPFPSSIRCGHIESLNHTFNMFPVTMGQVDLESWYLPWGCLEYVLLVKVFASRKCWL